MRHYFIITLFVLSTPTACGLLHNRNKHRCYRTRVSPRPVLIQIDESTIHSNLDEYGCLVVRLNELILPGQTRYLRFCDPRTTALFENAMMNQSAVFAFAFSVDRAMAELFRIATLVEVDEYKKLSNGIGVEVRGVGRVSIEDVQKTAPFTKITVSPYDDDVTEDVEEASRQLYESHEALMDLESSSSILSAVSKELDSDPRITQPRERMEFIANRKTKRRRTDDDDLDPPPFKATLRTRVRVARAAVTKNLEARDAKETRMEHELQSFLALEGSDLRAKVAAFQTQSTLYRMHVSQKAIEERRKLVVAKQAIEDLAP